MTRPSDGQMRHSDDKTPGHLPGVLLADAKAALCCLASTSSGSPVDRGVDRTADRLNTRAAGHA